MVEPNIAAGEAALQVAIVTEIRCILDAIGSRYLLGERFGLDVAVWISHGGRSVIKFIELKIFSSARQVGVGFGNGRGQGSQVDILICDESQLALMDCSTRWILADATVPIGGARFSIVTSLVAKRAAMRTISRGKQNNFHVTEFRRHMVEWPAFCDRFLEFFVSPPF